MPDDWPKAAVSYPPIGTVGRVGKHWQCPVGKIAVTFAEEDLGYDGGDDGPITLFLDPSLVTLSGSKR